MRDIRLEATGIIWVALAAILIFSDGGNVVPLAFLLGVAATASTGMVWHYSVEALKGGSAQDSESSLKHKRSDRTRRLIEVMEEDEIDDLEAYLAARRDDAQRR